MELAAGTHLLCLGGLADLARPHAGVDVACLTRPVSGPAEGREPPSCAGQSVRRGACRGTPAVCASATPPPPPSPHVGQAQAVRTTLVVAVSRPLRMMKTIPAGQFVAAKTGRQCRSTAPPTVAADHLEMGPKKGLRGFSRCQAATKSGAKKRRSGCVRLGVL